MKRRDFAKAGLAFGAATLAAPSIVRAQAATPVKFACDFNFQGNHSVFGMAIENGHYAKEKLAVKMDRGYGSGDTIVKIGSGAYDIGFADINAAVKFNAANPDKLKKLRAHAKRRKLEFHEISAVTGEGVEGLKWALAQVVQPDR